MAHLLLDIDNNQSDFEELWVEFFFSFLQEDVLGEYEIKNWGNTSIFLGNCIHLFIIPFFIAIFCLKKGGRKRTKIMNSLDLGDHFFQIYIIKAIIIGKMRWSKAPHVTLHLI